MTKRMEIYKCIICGNIVEMLHTGKGALVCCGKPMKLHKEKKADSATEKHVPVVEKTENGYTVTVGSTLHPMETLHYIEWIELISGNSVLRKHLKPGMEPKVEFVCGDRGEVTAREYCSVHGLWKDKQC